MIVAAVVFSGCSGEDDVVGAGKIEYSDVPVAFGEAVASAMADAEEYENGTTRGTAYESSWCTSNGSMMAVTAIHYQRNSAIPISLMDEQQVTYNSTAPAAWEYAPLIFWPTDGTMSFFGYAPKTDKASRLFSSLTTSESNYQAMLMKCHVPNSVVTTTDQFMAVHNPGTVDALPHDPANQEDVMFTFRRGMKCAEQSVTSKVNMNFTHVMAGVKIHFMTKKEVDPVLFADDNTIALDIPSETKKVLIGIGRIKTGGTLALCEPAAPEAVPEVEWTLDGLEGTFYESYEINGSLVVTDDTFFFPPQKFDHGLTVSAYFYDENNRRIDYRVTTAADLKRLERGKIVTLNIK